MKEGLAALTKLVKVVMSYRPDRKNEKPRGDPHQGKGSQQRRNIKSRASHPGTENPR